MEGEAEDQHHEPRGRGKRHRQRCVRSPERVVFLLDDDDLAGQRLDQPRRRQRAIAVCQDHVADDALLAGGGEQLRRADHVEHAVVSVKAGLAGNAGQHAAIRAGDAGDDDVTAGGDAPGRNHIGQQALQPLDTGGAILPDRHHAIEALGHHLGEGGKFAFHGRAFLPGLVDHLHEGAEADGDQERYDEGGHGATQRWLCRQ